MGYVIQINASIDIDGNAQTYIDGWHTVSEGWITMQEKGSDIVMHPRPIEECIYHLKTYAKSLYIWPVRIFDTETGNILPFELLCS